MLPDEPYVPTAEDEADYRQWCADVDSKLVDLKERARWENQCMLKFAP